MSNKGIVFAQRRRPKAKKAEGEEGYRLQATVHIVHIVHTVHRLQAKWKKGYSHRKAPMA